MSDASNPSIRNIERCPHRNLYQDQTQIPKLQASVISNLIDCCYYLKVSVKYNSFILSKVPTIFIPIIIYIPELKNDYEQYRPQQWQPTEMPRTEIDLPTAQELGLTNNNLEYAVPLIENQDNPLLKEV
jgi:hypothetical protein